MSANTAYEPDALVYCGPEKPGSDIEVPDPVIGVEVLFPGTRHVDLAAKLEGYFRVASIQHYLIADPEKRFIMHHARSESDFLQTRMSTAGASRSILRVSRLSSRHASRRSDAMAELTDAETGAATECGKIARRLEPRATAARYGRQAGRIVVELPTVALSRSCLPLHRGWRERRLSSLPRSRS